MFQAVLFILLANQRFSGLPHVQATSVSQIDAKLVDLSADHSANTHNRC
jgi:hypothetical protein